MFMPGIPQVWYLDLFAGKNDYAAADAGGVAGHKEINRTTLAIDDIERRLLRPVVQRQLDLIRLRNRSSAFDGEMVLFETPSHELRIGWRNGDAQLHLHADLRNHSFVVETGGEGEREPLITVSRAVGLHGPPPVADEGIGS